MQRVLVIGGSGAVGGFLLRRLGAAGQPVLALSRQQQLPRDGVQWLRAGLAPDLAVPAIDAVICAGPLDAFVDWLCAAAPPGLQQVVALSSMSAASKQASVDAAERELAARLAACEQRLAQHCEAHGVAWTVLRPTLIYGAGVDRSLSPLARQAQRYGVFPRIAAARGLRQPVHADDVAAACVAALAGAGAGQRFELGGGERLSYAQMLERVRAGLGRRTLPLPLPIYLLRRIARLSGRGAGMVQRLTQDLLADNALAEALLGYRPRLFRPGPECWTPASPERDGVQ